MRHRIDISPQGKLMLKELAVRVGMSKASCSAMAELCIQTAYEQAVQGEAFQDDMNPVLGRLDEIKGMLQEVLPEV